MDVELEHGTRDLETNVTDDDVTVTAKIARAHLNEFPDYYTRLAVDGGRGRDLLGRAGRVAPTHAPSLAQSESRLRIGRARGVAAPRQSARPSAAPAGARRGSPRRSRWRSRRFPAASRASARSSAASWRGEILCKTRVELFLVEVLGASVTRFVLFREFLWAFLPSARRLPARSAPARVRAVRGRAQDSSAEATAGESRAPARASAISAGWDDEHRARGRAYHPVADAAHDQSIYDAAAV